MQVVRYILLLSLHKLKTKSSTFVVQLIRRVG